ncbi:MAG: aminopeptidase P family protein [Candidatus Peregrinibacteria bacterium]
MKHRPQAFLITDKSNIKYLSNFSGSHGFMLLTKSARYLFTDFRYLQRARKSVKKNIRVLDVKEDFKSILVRHRVRFLGIEESNLTIAKFKKIKTLAGKIRFTDISGKSESLREIKSKEEIKLITKSQRINEKVFLAIKKIIQTETHLTELKLAHRVRLLAYEFGADDVSFEPIVAFGNHTSIPHHEPDNTKLKKGDIIMIDMGMKYKGYCSDMTRMIFTAPPTKKQREIYNLVLKAQLSAIKGISSGITGRKADSLARKIIEKAGYGENYGHAGGHGVGLDIHESPSLSEKYTKRLKVNSIITVEPGIYFEGKFGVRIEDMILITKTGNKNLTSLPKTI